MATNTDEIKKIKKQVNEIKDSMAAILKFMEDNAKKSEPVVEQPKVELIAESAKIEELENKIALMAKELENKSTSENKTNTPDLNRDVLFVSLCIGTLNLSTARNGGGDIYTFHEFGEEQMIPYSDAKNIIKNNKSFIKGGKVFIDDEELIKNERLTKDYENILSYSKLIDLFNQDTNTFETIFKGIPKGQKESFTDILMQKLIKGEKVDRNLIYIVNNELNTNIEEKIEYGKNLTE